jgi:hypothetical protein
VESQQILRIGPCSAESGSTDRGQHVGGASCIGVSRVREVALVLLSSGMCAHRPIRVALFGVTEAKRQTQEGLAKQFRQPEPEAIPA